jgi:YhgE/Pip-like protein
MKLAVSFFKQKLLWIGVVVVFVVIMVFGLAMMGSVIGAKPKDLPVALVILDQEVSVPGGGKVAVGKMIQEKLLSNSQLPIRWEVLGSEAEAIQGLDLQKYYGALVLPADMSADVASLQTPNPMISTVQIYVNEGMNAQAASSVKMVLQQVMQGVNTELSKQMMTQISQKMPQIPVQLAGMLLAPFSIKDQTVHPVGTNNAGGNAPNLLTQILWLGSMVTSVFVFLTAQKALQKGNSRFIVMLAQLVSGHLIVAAAASFLVWMAAAWYGMELTHLSQTWAFLLLAGSAFFLLQIALLNWIGFPAMGILVLLLFFSMPIISMAPEFLPQVAHDWLYSWIPFRFVASGLRNIMYYGGTESLTPIQQVLWSLAGGCLILLAVSTFNKIAVGEASTQQA